LFNNNSKNSDIINTFIPKKYENNYLVRYDDYYGNEKIKVYHNDYVVDKIKKIMSNENNDKDKLTEIANVLQEPHYFELSFIYA